MELLLKFFVILLGIDIIIVATAWYASKTIKPYYPEWWRKFVVADNGKFYSE